MLQKIRKMMKNDKGFTLIELMVVVVILGILAAIAIPRFVNKTADAEAARRKADTKIIQTAVDLYYFEEDVYPTNKSELESLVPTYLQSVPVSIETITIDDTTGKVGEIKYYSN